MGERTNSEALGPIVVVGMIGGEVFGREAMAAIDRADVVVGAPRHLDRLGSVDLPVRLHPPDAPEGTDGARRVPLTADLDEAMDEIDAARRRGERTCVLASGDPGFFGIVRSLGLRFGPDHLEVHPAPSSASLAFATVGESWDDAVVVSAHGRPLAPAIDAVASASKAAVLTDPTNPPQSVGQALLARGCTGRAVVVTRIGEADERTEDTDVVGLARGSFDPLSVVLLESGATARPSGDVERTFNNAWGTPEESFDHRAGMITKAEVRAVVLSKLSLGTVGHPGVFWDVGAGSGSIGIEAACLTPATRVFAVERRSDDAARIAANAASRGVGVDVVEGEAPSVLAGLPDPDRVFVGGGGIDLLDACIERLRPGGVIAATYVLMDRALAARERLGQMIQVRVDRCVPLGSAGVRMEPLNPVFVCWSTP